MQHVTLLAHRGATYVDREQLATIDPPAATATWKPIKHADFVDTIHAELVRRQIGVRDERYAVQPPPSLPKPAVPRPCPWQPLSPQRHPS